MIDAGRHPIDTLIEFTRSWGHPTRWEIYGTGQRARVSRRIADNLVSGGYARIVGS